MMADDSKKKSTEKEELADNIEPILYTLPYVGIYKNPVLEAHVKEHTQMCIVWAIEELGELSQAIVKKLRGQKKNGDLVEEIADVLLAIEQIRIACNIDIEEIQSLVDLKNERLKYRRDNGTLWHREKEDTFKFKKKLAVASVESVSDITLTDLRKYKEKPDKTNKEV